MLKRIRTRLPGRGQGPWILASSLLLAMLVTPFALAAGEGRPINGGARNPSANATQEYNRETEIIANNNTYGTRQSNKSNNGGGAIYGCRSRVGGSPANNEPCIRSNNLSDGRAFEFVTNGNEVGRIESKNTKAAPFTTNATGVATGLNADQVDGKSAEEIKNEAVTAAQAQSKFATVTATGTLGSQRGATAATRTAAGTYRVTFSGDNSKCAPVASVNATDTASNATIGVSLVDAATVEVVTRAVVTSGTVTAGDAVDRPVSVTLTC
jgi:hypothetical protein